jgi:hypothetical protein
MSVTERALTIVRVGRKRKAGERYANGELIKERKNMELAKRTAIDMPHRQSVSESDRFDQKAGTAIGRLFLRSIVTSEQYEAGTEYNRIVGLYRASIEAPRIGQSIAGIFEPHSGNPISVDTARDIRKRYNDAHDALAQAGRPSVMAVNKVAIHDNGIYPSEYKNLYVGLNALAGHFKGEKRR